MALELNIIKIEQGLDFILGHFEESIWPRTIFTERKTNYCL
jgi:hypothetical protein